MYESRAVANPGKAMLAHATGQHINADKPTLLPVPMDASFDMRTLSNGESHPLRVALYSHDTQGLGHIRRSLAIAGAFANLSTPPTTLLVAGIAVAGNFQAPDGADVLILPSVGKDQAGNYCGRRLRMPLDQIIRLRAQTIRAALADFAPDVLIVDKVPGGLQNELLPTLRMLRRNGTRCVLGLRDILDDPETSRKEWKSMRYTQLINKFYDAVWIYGDPAIYDAVSRYNLPPSVVQKVRYTGYIDRTQASDEATPLHPEIEKLLPPSGKKLALCMVGGGEDGGRVSLAFAQASLPVDTHGLLITGPYMPETLRNAVNAAAKTRTDLTVVDFVANPEQLLRHAHVVISMGGYNSICEILAHRTRALIVPRIHPRREQLERALCLQEMGVVSVQLPDEITSASLGAWMHEQLALEGGASHSVDMNALKRLPALLYEAAQIRQTAAHQFVMRPLRFVEQSIALLVAETFLAVQLLFFAS